VAAVGAEVEPAAAEAGSAAAVDARAAARRGPAAVRGPAAEWREAAEAGAPQWAACHRCRAPLEIAPAATSPVPIDRAVQTDKQWADSPRRLVELIDPGQETLRAIDLERVTSPGIGRTLAREEPETGRTFPEAGQLRLS
jgi:hypothetical protein